MKIFVWGTGFAAQELLENELADVSITAFIDNKKTCFKEYKVYSPEEAAKMSYDAVIVATGYAKEIWEQAKELGFILSKFIFIYNNYLFSDINQNYRLAEKIFGAAYVRVLKNRYHVIRGMERDDIAIAGGEIQ